MLTLRCTRKLLTRLKPSPGEARHCASLSSVDYPAAPLVASGTLSVPSTTVLGDWYCNLLFTRPQQLLLCVSEKTLLPVVLPARELETFVPRFRLALNAVLRGLGITEERIEAEDREMTSVYFAKTASREVVGVMTDFALMLGAARKSDETLLDLSLWLAKTPCSPLTLFSPDRATVELFAAERL